MFDRRFAWIAMGGLVLAGTIMSEGCSGADENATTGQPGVCGNGIKEAGEQCDDGNANDADGCTLECISSTCGDGEVQGENGEECDDGDNVDDNACSNNCSSNSEYCGNNVVDTGEDCDDGNTVTDDECTNACTDPRCGDGIVQAGESCDDGNSELNDDCPPDCMGGGGAGGDPCTGQAIFAGYVTNPANPTQIGTPSVPSVWAYAGELGVKAGDEMCAAIGADHVCSWAEVKQAETNGELNDGTAPDLPEGTEFWIHRITEQEERLSEAGVMSLPGPGGRCNDWTYPTDHISDGEFGYYGTPPNGENASTIQFGNLRMALDDDAAYEPNLNGAAATDNPGGGVIGGDHECPDNALTNIGNSQPDTGTAGCAGPCNAAQPKAILCCFPTCE